MGKVTVIRAQEDQTTKAVRDEVNKASELYVKMMWNKYQPQQTAIATTPDIGASVQASDASIIHREKKLALPEKYHEMYKQDQWKALSAADRKADEARGTSQESYGTQPGQMPISAGPSHPSSRDWNVPQYELEYPESGVDPRLDTPVSPMMQTSGGKHVVGRTRGGITSPMMQAAAGAGLDYGSVAHPSSAEAGYTSAMGGERRVGEHPGWRWDDESDTTPNKYQTSPAPMAQDLGGWERAPGSKVRPVAGGGDHRVVGTSRWRSKGKLETSDPVVANLRKEGGLVSIPTSERAWKSEGVGQSTEPGSRQASPEVLSSQGKLRNEMRANIEEEALAPREHWLTEEEKLNEFIESQLSRELVKQPTIPNWPHPKREFAETPKQSDTRVAEAMASALRAMKDKKFMESMKKGL